MRKIIFASHGKLASGLKNAASLIVGDLASDIKVFSLEPGGSADDFVLETEAILSDSQVDEVIIVTDLKGASVCNAFTLISGNPKVKLFSGMSLPLILDIILSYQQPLSDEDIAVIIDNARSSIQYVTMDLNDESEDF